jgi:pimeloyl-ACP methyl ester carboxylesterase
MGFKPVPLSSIPLMPTKAKSFRQLLWRLARPLIAAYLLAVVGCATFQNKLIYFPSRASEKELLREAQRADLEPWRDETGAIIGWRSRPAQSPSTARFLVFHGNAGYALHRWPYAAGFSDALPCEVFLLEYPGYGARVGSPNESTLLAAGEQAVRLLKKESALPVFIVGESIGSGVAAGVAARVPDLVSGLILITPLSSLDDVAAYHFRWLPVRLLLRDHYPAIEWLKKYHGPLAVTVASEDEIIPNKFGRKLYDSYAGPKRLWTKPGMHNTVHTSLDPLWWRAVVDFVQHGR